MSVAGTGRLLHGQKLHGNHQIVVPYTKQMESAIDQADALVGQAYTEIEPKDRGASDVLVYGPVDLSNYWLSYAGLERRMRLPDVLKSLSIVYEEGSDDANYNEFSTQALGGTGSIGCSLSGQCQASAFCIPQLVPQWSRKWQYNPVVTHYFFFGTVFDISTILATLSAKLGTTVNAWPSFGVTPLTFLLYGERLAATARATLSGSISISSGGTNTTQANGFGNGFSRSPSIRVEQFPECLHGAFTLTAAGSVSANAETAITSSVFGTSGGTANATATGSVSPSSVSATSPPALPTSGLYLFDFEIEPTENFTNALGAPWYFAHAVVFDFATLPTA